MHALLRRHRSAIAALCRRHRVQTLAVVGSAARQVDFNPLRSDVDFLVEYIPPLREDWFDRHMGLIVDLEALLERDVDVIERANLRKPDLIASLEADAQPLYAAKADA